MDLSADCFWAFAEFLDEQPDSLVQARSVEDQEERDGRQQALLASRLLQWHVEDPMFPLDTGRDVVSAVLNMPWDEVEDLCQRADQAISDSAMRMFGDSP